MIRSTSIAGTTSITCKIGRRDATFKRWVSIHLKVTASTR